ncbi:MAG: hypothetical protein ACI8PZ_003906 [Myxococcota bacterium]|jgi:hypothetical protein
MDELSQHVGWTDRQALSRQLPGAVDRGVGFLDA